MIYFITENFIKKNSPLTNNVNISKIEYLIEDSFELVIVNLLGYKFANFLLEKHQEVISGNDPYSEIEERLVGYIQKTMVWNVAFSSVEALSDSVTNKGAQKQFGDFSNSSTDSQIRFLSEKYYQRFQDYQDVLIDFLCKNKDEFPEFISSENKGSLILKNCGCGDNDVRDLGITVG